MGLVRKFVKISGFGISGNSRNYEVNGSLVKIIQFYSLILGEQKETIRALRTCGAHLQMGPLELGEKLCSFARLGDRKKLKCFKLAGTQNLTTDCSSDLPRFTQIVLGSAGQVK